MAYISRLVSLKGFDNVIIGRDIGGVLQQGVVYGVQSFGGVITLVPISEAVTPMKGMGLAGIIVDGKHYLTKDEYRAELEKQEVEPETIERYVNGIGYNDGK